MQEEVYRELMVRRAQLRQRWEALLRIERTSSPLANPDALVFMMDWTLDRIWEALNQAGPRGDGAGGQVSCGCGLNPLLSYFTSMEQALLESLVLAQAAVATQSPGQREVELVELKRLIASEAARELAAFCAVCQRRPREIARVAQALEG